MLLGIVLITSTAAVATLTVNTTTTTLTLTAEDWTADSATTVANTWLGKASATAAASGTSAPGTEAAAGLPTVNTALTADNWLYQFDVKEASAAGWSSTAQYKIEVFTDGTLAATVYLQNATADNASVEGVTVKVDLGSGNLPNGTDVKVTRTA